ncbi:DUF4232 domain-containing protein [Streptomyces sp. Ncost-T10-10d]|uniref:DUF4232 domain-containing protein n=1 Tax=Streptomyces sp. Ncost-T10-10d TaxID=1839774 RepID=UPI00081E2BAF|nr:DUF4232 domain-containing protein [Streptomyces sp. Ncost-T10-10d]SCF85789.1 Protein of unknown function [Streptomyces sp. Ncost-T10-10d]
MKYTRIAALAAIGVAATLSLTACGSDSSGKDSSSEGSSSSSSSSSSSDSGSKSEGGSGSGGSEAGNAKAGSGEDTKSEAASNGATKTSAKITFCKTEDLAIDARDAAPDKDSGRIDITMINRGSTTCSATGFAGVDIKDADHTSNPIERGHAQPRITTLKPGDAAVFNLAYDIDNTGKSLASPTNILVTPPNEAHTVNLKWPAGAGDIKGAYTDVEVYPTHTTE